MRLTSNFAETVRARVQRDERFRMVLLREAAECLLAGDVNTGRAVLRAYLHATVSRRAR